MQVTHHPQYQNDTEVKHARGFTEDEIQALYEYNTTLQTVRDEIELAAKLALMYLSEVN